MCYFSGNLLFGKFDKVNRAIFQEARIQSYLPPLNTWTHYVFTDNGTKTFSGMSIYINGVKQTVANGSSGIYTGMSNNNTSVYIGNAGWDEGNTLAFSGRIDEVGVWNGRELTQSEVSSLYNSGVGRAFETF